MSTIASAPVPVPQASMLSIRSVQALALLFAACLLAHAHWLSPWLTTYLASVAALRVVWQMRIPRPIPWLIRTPLLVLSIALVVVTTGSPVGRDGGAALLLALAVMKLVETRNLRDGRVFVAAVFFIAMTEFLFSQSLLKTIYIGVLAITAFVVLSLLRKYPGRDAESADAWSQWWPAWRGVARIAFAAIPLAAAVFLFFPRLGAPLWGAPWRGNEAKTGISDEMSPGQFASLMLDDTPAFRVTFDGAAPDMRDLYWRGPVLWRFDGRTWTPWRGLSSGDMIPLRYRSESVVRYEQLLEPTERNWYFPLDLPLRSVEGARLVADGQLIADKPIIAPKRLRLQSATQFVFDETPQSGHRWAALQLPTGSNPKAVALAQRWRAEAKDDDAVIAAALSLFNTEFSYSLEPPPLIPDRSVDDFLFETRTGYCEHFASSFVFLMRAAGIPARVVTGYMGGYWNTSGQYLIVRNSDAHAWAEVWQAGRGWQRIDPTNAVAPERISRGSNADGLPGAARWYHSAWALAILDQTDRVSRWWRQRIVDFDALRQSQMLSSFGIEKAEWQQLVIGLGILGGLALALGVWWSMRGLSQRPSDPLLLAWRIFCKRLAASGTRRHDYEGPVAYAHRAALVFPKSAAQITRLGVEFAQHRYDPAADSAADDRKNLQRALRRFRLKR